MSWIVNFEVLSGPEGPCLIVTDGETGYRLAGPKPWGGGVSMIKFQVDYKEAMGQIKAYKMKGE